MQIQKIKKTELGEIPEEWNVVTIDEICDIKGGKRLPLGKSFSPTATKYPYIRVVDFRNGGVDTRNLQYLGEDTYQLIKNYTISIDDLYFSIAGTVGLVGKIPPSLNGANLTENAAKLCKIKNITQDYLMYFLNSKIIKNQIKSYIGHVSQPKLALFRLGKLNMFLPPIQEQQKIASILTNVDNLIQKNRSNN
ncbi:MAG TPA: restriction endonuclease subunit S [Nitrososphaeraceae archaeon]|nr:restriction endonuclease subunit S [Nitrososphaeraceae archaeon]